MKPKLLLKLVAVLVVLGLIAFIAKRTGGSHSKPDTAALRGQKVLDGWPVNDIESIQVKSPEGEVNLTKADNLWVVNDRKDYPADPSKVSSMLVKLWETPVVQAFEAGASQNERLALLAPDAEEGDDENKATKITFKGKGNAEIGHVLIGKNNPPESRPGQNPMEGGGGKASRFLRTSKNGDLVLEVANNFTETLSGSGWPYDFGAIAAEPGEWLNKTDFIKVQKIESVAVNFKEGDNESYSLSRESDTGDYTLAGEIPEGKVLDGSKVSSLKTILGSASFEDLLTEEQAKEIDEATATEVKLTTFEGFTYNVFIGKKDDEENRIPIKFTVSGDFPTERKVEEGKEETEEEKKTADEAFQKELKENSEKLTKEKALEGHWFALSSYRVDALLKSRPDLLKDEEKEEPPASLAKPDLPAAAPELPPGLGIPPTQATETKPAKPKIEAVSKPVRIPPISSGATATTPPIEIPRPPAAPPAVEPTPPAVEPTPPVEEPAPPAIEVPTPPAVEVPALPAIEVPAPPAIEEVPAVEEAAADSTDAVENPAEAGGKVPDGGE